MRTERDQDQPYERASDAPKRRRWRVDGQEVITPQAYAVRQVDRRWKERVATDRYRRRTLMLAPGMVRLASESTSLSDVGGPGGARGIVTGWTPGSQRRLRQKFAKIEWPRMQLVFITLTEPDRFTTEALECELECCTDRRRGEALPWKESIRRFAIQWERRFGSIYGMWVQEFQDRGAPHYHLAMIIPNRVPMGVLREWVADTWHELAGHGDHGCKDRKGVGWHRACFHSHGDHRRCWHRRNHATTEAVKLAHSSSDLMKYLQKELRKGKPTGKKAYQKTLPAWLADRGAGRWWGVWGLVETKWEQLVSGPEAQQLRRMTRRLLQARRVRLFKPGRNEWVVAYEYARVQWHLATIVGRYLDWTIRGPSPPTRPNGFLIMERRAVAQLSLSAILEAACKVAA